MTMYQQNLVDEAVDMWSRGFPITIDLYSKLAAEGLDVPKLEAIHFNP